ncbi:MAG: hypothetical protein M0R03_19300 [Novosphingobium sp.]|nr:hypothetical protein [Novosphingobium sp.]
MTDEGQKSNGSGKSALQNAVEFVYRGDFSRKVNKASLIRRGENRLEVEHCAFNNKRGEYMIIHRILPKKGSESVNIYICIDLKEFEKNREEFKVDISSTLESNKWIERYVDVSREDMSNYFFPNELTYKSFFENSDTKNKELISRFSNAEIVDSAFLRISEERESVVEELSKKEKEILTVEAKIDTRRGDLLKEKERDFDKEKKAILDDINVYILNKKDNINRLLVKKENSNKTLKNTSEKIKSELIILSSIQKELDEKMKTKPDFTKQSDELEIKEQKIKSSIKEVDMMLDELSDDRDELIKKIREVDVMLSGKITCPNCKHEFLLNEDFTLEELNEKIYQLNSELKDVEADIEESNKVYDKFKLNSKRLKDQIEIIDDQEKDFKDRLKVINKKSENQEEVISKLNKDVEEVKSEIHGIDLEIQSENKSIELKESEKKEVEEQDFSKKSKAKEYEKEIKSLNKELKYKEKEQESIFLRIDEIDAWKNYFVSFKSFLVNKKLKVIEGMMNKFLQDMNVDYQIKLEGYKTVNNGKDVREKITPYVFKDGETYNYNEFSKGERTRMNFANLLTLQTLINETSKNGGLSILFLDEILEGLDEEGLALLLDSTNDINKTILLTTHINNEKIHDNVLIIEKNNGISKII